MGRITASRKQLKPDPVYGSILASKFINCLMYDGKKSTAQAVFYDAMDLIKERLPDAEPIECGLRTGFKLIEPPAHAKGNAARSLFHMHFEYDLPLPLPLDVLRRWHQEDPADQVERIRNDRIALLQGTRNRFIDNPEAVELLQP